MERELRRCPFCGGETRYADPGFGVAKLFLCVGDCKALMVFRWNTPEVDMRQYITIGDQNDE